MIVTDGLNDLSNQLGETTVNTTNSRIKHYSDAFVAFFKYKKWRFATKKNTSITTVAGTQRYSIAGITDMRKPGGIKEIYIGDEDDDDVSPIYPVEYGRRKEYAGGSYFAIDEESNEIVFTAPIATTGDVITIRYYYIPVHLTALTDTVAIPEEYRKEIAALAASFVQRSRYLDAQANQHYNMFLRLVEDDENKDSESHTNLTKKLNHPLKHIGFQRKHY